MKKHGWKGLVSGVALLALLVALAVPALAVTGQKQMEVDYMDIKLAVDGVPVGGLHDSNGNTVQPFVCEGTTYLPVRAVGEALGKEVRWDGPTHTVYITDPAEPKAMTVNSYYGASARKETIDVDYLDIKLVVDGKEVTPKDVNGKVVEPFAYNGTTYLPVRAVGEALGKTVRWDGETKTVHLGEMPQGTYLVDVCKAAAGGMGYNNASYNYFDYYINKLYRAADYESFTMTDGKRYSQGFTLNNNKVCFELGGRYESLTFDLGLLKNDAHWTKYNKSADLWVYLDGKEAQKIEVTDDDGVQRVTIPLNYAQIVGFSGTGGRTLVVANAILSGEREAPAKPVPPANATYLVDACTIYPEEAIYKAAKDNYYEDEFGNKYTNGLSLSWGRRVTLNGKYKTLKATVFSYYDGTCTFSVDGEVVGEVSSTWGTPPQTIEIPLNYGMKLEIDASDFFLADVILE